MKILKQIYFCIIALLLSTVFFGCSKNSSTTADQYYLKFRANGNQVTYTPQGLLYASFVNTTGTTNNCVITGGDDNSNVNLQIYDIKPVKDSSYSDYKIASNSSAIVGVVAGYSIANGNGYSSSTSPFSTTVTISEISTTSVKGTFFGKFKTHSNDSLNITEGEFFVKKQ